MNYLAKSPPDPILWQNEPIELPNEFYIWVFNRYRGENYDSENRNAEYGISIDDFINQYYPQALDDARNYIIENIEELPDLISRWKQSIRNEIDMLNKSILFELPKI